MLQFLCGLFCGGLVGVGVMALFVANHEQD